ncbi:MBL fold metallo-hydrolase [Paenibacillus sp. UMB4589-SE434]|uniref:MBL fold metallo-hydrolase n=1 Tax=Paenibacillus sp. UMB4589-SE434 TaxID=3046314 RepID=UPI00254A18CE|nr:MBL fold metallo-hydrolase [Paenibacillus sp. UMB4589-SE434]MDK8182947.1 MBL fold metallo-hydrolase [Paenibacillus sp. UMB4589-SE434]
MLCNVNSIQLNRDRLEWQCVFLGNSDSLGVPRVYCNCPVCEEARQVGHNRRYRSSVLLYQGDRQLLVDCGPDWPLQMELTGIRFIADILITHAHQDHIAGLPAYADVCRWLERRGRVIAPQEVIDTIKQMYGWLDRHIDFIPMEQEWIWEAWRVRPIRVNHGKNGYSYAYRFERDQPSESDSAVNGRARKSIEAWAYASDAIGLGEYEKSQLQQLNLLVIGTNFYHEPFAYETRSVYDMVEAIELLQEIRPTHTIFTHMSHGVDVREPYPLPKEVRLAHTGLTITL